METNLESLAPKMVRPIINQPTALEFWAYCRVNKVSPTTAATEAISQWLQRQSDAPQERQAS